MSHYTIGIDYGTNSVRAIVVDCADGSIHGAGVFDYPHGDKGVVGSPSDPHLARQHPRDYLDGLQQVVREALHVSGVDPSAIKGIGVDATASTPLPVDAQGQALALQPEFADNPHAMAWLWKDHTAHAEASEITASAAEKRPEWLRSCGGAYSSEWYWSKLLRCARIAPEVFAAAHTWVELPDWIPAVLTGSENPATIKRCACAAGHKGLFVPQLGGWPDAEWLGTFDHGVLSRVRSNLPEAVHPIGKYIGGLAANMAQMLGLPAGIPVSAGIIDAHAGAVGSGVALGAMVKIIGTSTCDIALLPLTDSLPDIPGICGIAHESVLPGYYGLEAGQSAVGDIFNWFVHKLLRDGMSHDELNREASDLRPGQSGLLALDWHNGNRSLLTDPNLTGLLLGMTLHTTPAEIFRALVEATAFGARMIVERLRSCGVPLERVINCGGIASKSPLTMQIYADVLGCDMEISDNPQSCALGAAMAGAVAAGIHADFAAATAAMTRLSEKRYAPVAENTAIYNQLFVLYRECHDAFGKAGGCADHFDVMKKLLHLKKVSNS